MRDSLFASNGEVQLFAESFGQRQHPAILLLMGATAQGVMWKDEFCLSLAQNGFFVIRYDHRDTGKSSRIDFSSSPYYLKNLAEDAMCVLNAYGIEKAHWVGVSMGSFITQMNAIEHPDRALSITCWMSSPNHMVFVEGFEGKDVSHHMLPAPNASIMAYYEAILGVDVSDGGGSEAMEKYRQLLYKVTHVPPHMVETRVAEGIILRRLKNTKYIHNHSRAMALSAGLRDRLHAIDAPALVIHGREDYILPVEHGRKLASELKNSTFIEYAGVGHTFPNEIWPRLHKDITGFLAKL